MQPANRSARPLSPALMAVLVAVLVACGVALSGGSGADTAPSRMPQYNHAVPEQQYVVTAHAHRSTVVNSRRLDHQRYGGGSGPVVSLGTVTCATPTGVVSLVDGRLASPHLHHVAPACARAPPV